MWHYWCLDFFLVSLMSQCFPPSWLLSVLTFNKGLLVAFNCYISFSLEQFPHGIGTFEFRPVISWNFCQFVFVWLSHTWIQGNRFTQEHHLVDAASSVHPSEGHKVYMHYSVPCFFPLIINSRNHFISIPRTLLLLFCSFIETCCME